MDGKGKKNMFEYKNLSKIRKYLTQQLFFSKFDIIYFWTLWGWKNSDI